MFVAPLVSGAVVATTANAARRARGAGRIGPPILGLSVVTGLVGLGFHLRNTAKRIGGWRASPNVFYGAPVAAPLAATLAGVLGLTASRDAHALI